MIDGLMANIDLANHNKESYAYMSNGLVADRLSYAYPTSPSCRSYRAGIILSGEDTLQKIIAMQEIKLYITIAGRGGRG
jgi:hypothetical protein